MWELLTRFFAAEIQMWQGNAPLKRVFWCHGVILSNVLLSIYGATIYLGWPLAEQFLLVILALYMLWILVAIWRCAAGTETVWGLFARMLTIAWAVNTTMILLFRELDLIMLFLD
ncbi:hypothetical protein [uncultured Aliiroseovarius sp.]|uniref:hypothetical protein n=1 Tax=uncultured Aliiroseovarius sp. TaxID=1658783 RepID=UPI002598DD34|nr:hypothetical protein [uncultured Aliiroseovarius sp.]